MRKRRKILIIVLVLVMVILGACGDSATELKENRDNELSNHSSKQDQKEENKDTIKEENNKLGNPSESINDTKSDAENSTINTAIGLNDEVSSENSSSNKEITESKKKEYLQQLKEAKNETEQLEPLDTSTYALIKVESDRWEIWDNLLNEIYGVLIEQLTQDEMDKLRDEQLNWIKYRDEKALEASQKYKGGTQENLEYVSVLANLTEERCYELVKDYMK